MKKNTKYIISILSITAIFLVLQFIFAIPLNPFIAEAFPFYMLYFAAIGISILSINLGHDFSLFVNPLGAHIQLDKKKYIIPVVLILAPVVIFVVSNILSTPLFTWGILKNQIGKIEERNFEKDFEKFNVGEAPVIDETLALRLAEKKLGEKPELVSQVKVTTPTIQLYNNKLVWVVPLEHSGLFKWISNMEGTPGYIIVSATDQKDVTFVDNHKIKYQKEAYLHQDLKRKAQYRDLLSGLIDYSFELNEQGVPHWVITTYSNKFLFNIPEATGAVVVNAETGKTEKYSINNLPKWIDRIQPEEFIISQINNNGKYINGILNFSQKNMYKTSPGASIIYNNGRCYLFTGITSVSNDDGAIAFYLTDMINKKTYKYMMSGATENAAAMSAEGKVQNLGYKASSPILVNVDASPTYFMTLRDKEGLIKQYAFVNVEDYTTVGNGESKEEALNNYRKNMRNTPNVNVEVLNENIKKIEGTIKRIASENINNNLVYKFILNEIDNKVFEVNSKKSEYLALTMVGDKVKIEYIDNDKGIIPVEKYENLSI